MRRRRFPLLSLLVALALAAGVGYLTYLDVDVPRRALDRMGQAVARLGESLQLMSHSIAEGTVILGDRPYDAAATPAPTARPLPLLVNADHPLPEGYVPGNLVRMRDYCDSKIVTIKGSEIDGDREAVDMLMAMLRAAIAQGVDNWQISAGYRSVAYQQTLWDERVYDYRQQGLSGSEAKAATARYVALPGSSEHHTGLAFDVTVPGESFPLTEQSKWLAEHCWEFGFTIRYTEEKAAITGIAAEPWHIRYVGQPHARILQETGWCLEEYIENGGAPAQ
ncbi:MAG: M15 family metallopeptidase [Oscillospiraceae bacterium]|jgi:D-alanyl-D-alanine carboxypeptidase|nr:M15 family metallopeptidase [Oscillospiraceae bacterium]